MCEGKQAEEEEVKGPASNGAVTSDTDMITEIKQQALVFALDNLNAPSRMAVLMIEQAMLLGASIAVRRLDRLDVQSSRERV